MTNNTPNPADLRRTILEQVKLDQEAFARLSPVKQRACINELRSIGYNPSVEFPANPTLVEEAVERITDDIELAESDPCGQIAHCYVADLRTLLAALPTDDDVERVANPLGDAGDALDYALDHIHDDHERVDFLECWRSDDLEDWPEYLKWVALQQKCAAESKAAIHTLIGRAP